MESSRKIELNYKSILIVTLCIFFILFAYLLSNFGLFDVGVMSWIIVFIILLANVLLYFTNSSSNIVLFFTSILLVLLIGTAYSVNHSNTDLEAYEKLYEFLKYGGSVKTAGSITDLGFKYLMKACIYAGLSYNWFTTIVSFLALILMYSTIKHLSSNYHFVLVCYAIMSLTYDVYQIRFLLAYSFIVCGLKYYLVPKYYKPWKFIIFVLIASLVHFSMLFYLIILVSPLKRGIMKYYKIIVSIAVALILICYALNINIFSLLRINWFGRGFYASSEVGRVSIFTSLYIVFIILYMIFISKKMVDYQNNNEYIKNLFLLNILCTLICPFLAITLEFERFLRPVLVLDYACMSCEDNLPKKERVQLSILFIFICLVRVSVMTRLVDYVVNNNYFMDYLF